MAKKEQELEEALGKLSFWRNVDCRGREQTNKKKCLEMPPCQGLLSDFSKLKAIIQGWKGRMLNEGTSFSVSLHT